MKRLLSAILAIAMILALVPVVFAADAGEMIFEGATLDSATVYTNEATTDADKINKYFTHSNGVVEISQMNVRRYAIESFNAPMLVVEFTVPVTGEYTISFKTDETGIDKASTAAAPKVYISTMTSKQKPSLQFKSFLADDSATEVGYFDFSKLTTKDEYMPIKIDADGNEVSSPIKTATLTANKTYTLVLWCDANSIKLSPKSQNGITLVRDEHYIVNASGAIRLPDDSGVISTVYKQNIRFTGIKFTQVTPPAPEEDEELKAAFEPDNSDATIYAPSVDAATTVAGTSATKQADGSYEMVAPETDANGNKFLYWAKGLSLNKKIVSLEREFTYTPATGERNFLIPVYAPESAKGNEYYNANGQLIDCVAEAPALPSMAGYGKASEWVQYKDTNIYVAEYDETEPYDVTVTVNGTENTVPYGADVTCTAEDKDANDNPFKCWIKSNINGKEEIVSCDKSYTFKAWENCTVTAVYEKHIYTGAKMKIIIDSFNIDSETGIMAEFIGLDNAVEKGIMFGTQKIAMTKPGSQFTVTADENGTFTGYAIVEDGNGGYTLITDGSCSK